MFGTKKTFYTSGGLQGKNNNAFLCEAVFWWWPRLRVFVADEAA